MRSVGLAIKHEQQLPHDPASRPGSLHARCYRKFHCFRMVCEEVLIIAGIQGS
jgi:hypothetical protein